MTHGTSALCASTSAPAADHTASHGALGVLQGLWRAYWAQRARRTTAFLLRSLDDRTLADIGLERSEIESVVRDKSGQRLRAYRPNWE
jgi:uncharacterized protein YjiS (DUF1127 family)